jgi:hypothetical protein
MFELIRLDWEVDSVLHAVRLRAALPHITSRRPGQALIDAAAAFIEEISIRESTELADRKIQPQARMTT